LKNAFDEKDADFPSKRAEPREKPSTSTETGRSAPESIHGTNLAAGGCARAGGDS
jgi:hypothetical protein